MSEKIQDKSLMGDFHWPEWVPETIQKEILRSYTYHHGHFSGWIESATRNAAPEFGSTVSLPKLASNALCAPGRFVFAWNNIGRVVHEDGTFDYVSFESAQDDILRYLF